jgi:gentisate 1,2-dioxygenase
MRGAHGFSIPVPPSTSIIRRCRLTALSKNATERSTPGPARLVRIRDGESLRHEARASTALFYVIEGSGSSIRGGDAIAWSKGDAFCLPGGDTIVHLSLGGDSVLWAVTNEPQLAFEHFAPPADDESLVDAVHFPAAAIDAELDQTLARLANQRTAGLAAIMASEKLEDRRNISPTLTFAMNQMRPRSEQEPHSHNSIAVSLAIDYEDCYSVVDGARKDWEPFVTTVTPPGSVHSHHNDGAKRAKWLIVQDGGFFYHTRTMGFKFENDA